MHTPLLFIYLSILIILQVLVSQCYSLFYWREIVLIVDFCQLSPLALHFTVCPGILYGRPIFSGKFFFYFVPFSPLCAPALSGSFALASLRLLRPQFRIQTSWHL